MSEVSDENTRRIDLGGAVRRLWRYKWVWLAVFAVIAGIGIGYTLSRPANTTATVWVQLTLPETDNEAAAVQQSSLLSPMALSYVDYATTAPYTDAFVAKHPEFEDPNAIKGAVQVQLRNVALLEFAATGADPQKQATLAYDLASSFVETLNAQEGALVMRGKLHGDAMLAPSQTNRSLLMGASVLAAAAVATATAATLAYRRRADHPAP